jgi:hypothetical protein
LQLKGKASLNPWHVDRYVVRTDMSLNDLGRHVVTGDSRPESLKWKLDTERRDGRICFWVWGTDYIGFESMNSVAECVAHESEGASVVEVDVKVSDIAILIAIGAMVVGLLIALAAPGLTIAWIISITVAWVLVQYIALRQVRRRDPPQRLALRLAESVNGTVVNAGE